jgi:hypothetical protein
VITPLSSSSILSAAGRFGSPGMVRMSPMWAMLKPAPDAAVTFLTDALNFAGRPSLCSSSESDSWVEIGNMLQISSRVESKVHAVSAIDALDDYA